MLSNQTSLWRIIRTEGLRILSVLAFLSCCPFPMAITHSKIQMVKEYKGSGCLPCWKTQTKRLDLWIQSTRLWVQVPRTRKAAQIITPLPSLPWLEQYFKDTRAHPSVLTNWSRAWVPSLGIASVKTGDRVLETSIAPHDEQVFNPVHCTS